jgi:hypothetical protein
MLDQRIKERIAAEEAARFMDGSFGQLDLSGFPDLTHPQTETFELQDRHGFNRVDESGLSDRPSNRRCPVRGVNGANAGACL